MMAVRKYLLKAVDLHFLKRLLHTTAQGQPSPFQVVAITILACLCQDQSLVLRCISTLPGVVAVLDIAKVGGGGGGGDGNHDSERFHQRRLSPIISVWPGAFIMER